MLKQPAYGGVPRFVEGNGTLFLHGNYLVLFLQSPMILSMASRKILLLDKRTFAFAGSNQGCLVANVGNIGP